MYKENEGVAKLEIKVYNCHNGKYNCIYHDDLMIH